MISVSDEADTLLAKIGRDGDALWGEELSDSDQGVFIPFEDHSYQILPLAHRLLNALETVTNPAAQWLLLVPGVTLLLPFDLLILGLRLCAFPFVYALWAAENGLARLMKLTYFCPLCHNPMQEPLVYCPNPSCRRVQSRLEPTSGSLFFRFCPGCGISRWNILGGHSNRRPTPLVCRATRDFMGCYRPHRLPKLAGRHSAFHVAVIGSTVRAKHAAMAHLLRHLSQGAIRSAPSYQPACNISRMELQLFEKILYRSLQEDTRRFQHPGKVYSLARSLVLKADGRRQLLVLHNIIDEWTSSEGKMATDMMNWMTIQKLILVLEAGDMELTRRGSQPSRAELFARLLRRIEKDLTLDPGSRIPIRVAVVLVTPESPTTGSRGEVMSSEQVSHTLLHCDPALNALLSRSVRNINYYGGSLPDILDLSRSRWIQEVVKGDL